MGEVEIGKSRNLGRELSLAARFAGVSMVGFLADYGALRGGMALGLGVQLARVVSLGLALQITFALSHALVFRERRHEDLLVEWRRFMLANGFGGLCNYWIFVSLMMVHWTGVFGSWTALMLAAGMSYAINYAGTRLFVYGRAAGSSVPRIAIAPRKAPALPVPGIRPCVEP